MIDWSDCPLVESVRDVQGGSPVLKGTRMPADNIVDNFDYGVPPTEIAEQFNLPLDRVEAIVLYAQNSCRIMTSSRSTRQASAVRHSE